MTCTFTLSVCRKGTGCLGFDSIKTKHIKRNDMSYRNVLIPYIIPGPSVHDMIGNDLFIHLINVHTMKHL